MNLPTVDQVNAALRHGGSYAGGILTVFTVFGMLPQDQAQAAIADVQQIVQHLSAAFGAFSNLAVLVGPAFAALMMKFAGTAASLKSQLASVTTNPQVKIEPGAIKAPAAIANALNDKVVPDTTQEK